jgi:imidazolonepropionase-like amidohydrolase
MRLRSGILILVIGLSAQANAATKESLFAIVGSRVLTVSGPALENGTVLLRDGVIDAVGASLAIPADARVIDGKGLTLTPGLIDGFGSVGLPASKPGADVGQRARTPSTDTSPLAPQALALEKLKPSDAMKARDAGVTTALVIPKEGVLPGRSVLVDLAGDDADAMVVKQPAAFHLHMTTLRRQYPSSLMGTVAYARQALYDAARYRDEWAVYERAPRGKKRPRYDARLVAWQDVLAGRIPLAVTAHVENDVRRAVTLADEFKVRVLLVDAPQAFRVANLIKSRALPLIVGVNYDPPTAPDFFGPADDEREKRRIAEARSNPAELARAGVAFGFGSAYAADYVAGIREAIDKGLPREMALRAATLGAAEALGVADRTGSIDKGKLANLVAWSGDPLTKDAKAKLVFVDGALYYPEEKPEKKKDEDKPAAEVER